MKNTGFDFSRDLDRVAIAIESAQHGSKMTAVAEGHFDQAKIAAYATLKGKSTLFAMVKPILNLTSRKIIAPWR